MKRPGGDPEVRRVVATSHACWRAGGRSRIKQRLAGVLVVALGVAVLAPAGTAQAAKPLPPPKGLPAFYSVPQPLPNVRGKLVKVQKLASGGLHGTLYRVMYTSLNLQNKYVAITGVIVVPNGTPPAGGFPVVSWAHGTNGMADVCAPSLSPTSAAPL